MGCSPELKPGISARLAAADGIEISLLVGTDAGDPLRVGRNHECGAVHAFRRDRLALAGRDIVDIELHAFAGFVSGKQNALAVGKPMRPGVVDVVFREILALAGARGQQLELRGRCPGSARPPTCRRETATRRRLRPAVRRESRRSCECRRRRSTRRTWNNRASRRRPLHRRAESCRPPEISAG